MQAGPSQVPINWTSRKPLSSIIKDPTGYFVFNQIRLIQTVNTSPMTMRSALC